MRGKLIRFIGRHIDYLVLIKSMEGRPYPLVGEHNHLVLDEY